MIRFWIFTAFLISLGCYICVKAQDDFSSPVTCYKCMGTMVNSSCADPVNVNNISMKECPQGLCIKWTRKLGGVWYMERTCSDDLTIYISLIDRVCRTERNGNGYLCMCGKHLCNAANSPVTESLYIKTIAVTALSLIFMVLQLIL
ncbi:protein quiver isoform X2 [Octopus bimaculoides]|uniref:protein quiver isoform X2 n=1 Tax=Octopus bimaculoides TaxID=37653 RepID=UPI00071C5EB8|nr:protein quiver isoform X2 [Octopus bimaculoides]|eukprot:XP_014778127.1 PREDICTED: protein quiver-like isoform X2 [Octopus bimaculoides]